MFLGAVARPRRSTSSNTDFDRKIGLYLFTKQQRAQRNSRNRPAGSMVTNVEVTKESYKKTLLDHVIPDIKRRFPRPPGNASPEERIVYPQQDNARPHGANDDPDLREAMSSDGWNIQLMLGILLHTILAGPSVVELLTGVLCGCLGLVQVALLLLAIRLPLP